MLIRDVKAMVTYAFSYADEIGRKKTGIYPQDAPITLRSQVKDDILVMLGYLYDFDTDDLYEQVNFINSTLEITITPQNFLRFVEDRCSEQKVMSTIPLSLQYFVKDDTSGSRRMGYGVSLAKFLVNTFNDVACYFVAFSGVSDFEAERMAAYINMLKEYLDAFDLLNPRGRVNEEFNRREMERSRRNARELGGSSGSMWMRNVGGFDRGSGLTRGGSLGGSLLSGAMIGMQQQIRDDMKTYSSAQADMDVALMIDHYNKMNADKGTGFDVNLLKEAPSGQVDRSMVVDGGTAEAVPCAGNNSGAGQGVTQAQDLSETGLNVKGPGQLSEEKLQQLLDELDSLIGLSSVKKNLNNLINLVKIRKMRTEMGLKVPDISLHLVFSGNPGTGKTTVARLLAEIYHQLGVVSKGQFIEVDRAGLVEGYVGQTAIKTSKVCDSAMGGILFIDEAYTLTSGEGQDFGQEAVDTILKRMEDSRSDFVVIVAGYTNEMKEFVESNPGLKSRFNKFIEFPDYTGDELYDIFKLMCDSQDYVLTGDAEDYVKKHLVIISENSIENFANAREVRNYFERCVERQASRLINEESIDANTLTTFKIADVEEE